MGIRTSVGEGGKTCEIEISGNFQFALNQEFRKAYSQITEPGACFSVDLEKTEYMDSSALGMLLLLKKYADERRGSVQLKKPQAPIRRVLEIASFDKIFTIEY
jgi:anti-anti-sigma factor